MASEKSHSNIITLSLSLDGHIPLHIMKQLSILNHKVLVAFINSKIPITIINKKAKQRAFL